MKTAILGHLTPFARIVFVILLLITGLIVTLGLAILFAIPIFHINLLTDSTVLTNLNNPAAVALMKYLQIIQAVGIFILPPLLAGYLFEKNILGWLGMKKNPGVLIFFIVILIMLFSIPFISWMVSVNESMKLPSFMAGIEQWMHEAEDQASQLTTAFLNVSSASGFLVNILMIVILPAVGEELLFRGLLQRLFADWFRNAHVAIFITAFIFGAVHLQFYGLLPRVLLGVIFGYLYYWTGSLWVPVFAHFLNNGAVVIAAFLSNLGIIRPDYEPLGGTDNFFLIAGSLLVTVGLLVFVYGKYKKEGRVSLDHGQDDAQG